MVNKNLRASKAENVIWETCRGWAWLKEIMERSHRNFLAIANLSGDFRA